MGEDGRPQDQDRRHRKAGSPSPETASLLADYQAAMRTELRAVLTELEGVAAPTGLLDTEFTTAEVRTRPSLADRMKLWDLGIKLGRELGTEVDPGPLPGAAPAVPPSGPRRRTRVDYGPDR